MKPWYSFISHYWRAKLVSLVLATLLWLFMRHSINYSPNVLSPLPPSSAGAGPPPVRPPGLISPAASPTLGLPESPPPP